MSRHFLRDKNGEEAEIAPCIGSNLDEYYMYIVTPRKKSCHRIDVKKVEIWINQKLEFIVWQEV